MALADYYLCDICGYKTFYDAWVEYLDDTDSPRGVGDMKVICKECAKNYRVVIEKIKED